MSDHPTISRLSGRPTFETDRTDWWGYRVSIPGQSAFDYWVLGADYIEIGDGYIQREAVDERLGDGRNPHECDDPHPDAYYDEVWNLVIEDLHASDNPPIYA